MDHETWVSSQFLHHYPRKCRKVLFQNPKKLGCGPLWTNTFLGVKMVLVLSSWVLLFYSFLKNRCFGVPWIHFGAILQSMLQQFDGSWKRKADANPLWQQRPQFCHHFFNIGHSNASRLISGLLSFFVLLFCSLSLLYTNQMEFFNFFIICIIKNYPEFFL